MTDVDDQVCSATDRECFRGVRPQRNFLLVSPGGGGKKIADGGLDLASFVSIRNQNNVLLAVLEYAAFENRGFRGPARRNEFPFLAGFEERLHAIGRTPIEVTLRIAAVAENSRHWNDSLMLIVCERNKNVDGSRRRLQQARRATKQQQNNKCESGHIAEEDWRKSFS